MTDRLADPLGFWDTRHRTVDEWRSGGDRSLSQRSNKAFYQHRLGLLTGILDKHLFDDRQRILDAGCGKGWLVDRLCRLGHQTVGIDASESAIGICRKHRQGTFHCTELSDFHDAIGFNAVVALDVLFHVLDDTVWRRSLCGLAGNLRPAGLFVLTDVPSGERQQVGSYIVHRPLHEYAAVLGPLGLTHVDTVAYDFARNPNAFLVFAAE